MIAYIVRWTLLAAFTIFVISFLSFMIVQLPEGDLFDQYYRNLTVGWGLAGPDRDRIVELREEMGLFDPVVVQWWD